MISVGLEYRLKMQQQHKIQYKQINVSYMDKYLIKVNNLSDSVAIIDKKRHSMSPRQIVITEATLHTDRRHFTDIILHKSQVILYIYIYIYIFTRTETK